MIRLRRGPKPEVLEGNEHRWTDEYRRLKSGDPGVPAVAATRYRDEAIKAQSRADTHGKCAYCESRPLHVSPGTVEHLLPKSRFPQLIVQWENLAFVCPECNTAKGDYHIDTEAIINPFVEDPAEHLTFAGPLVFERPGSVRGIVTVRKLGLDRGALVERRTEHLRKLRGLLNSWGQLPAGGAKSEIAAEIAQQAADTGEYAAITRAFLVAVGFSS